MQRTAGVLPGRGEMGQGAAALAGYGVGQNALLLFLAQGKFKLHNILRFAQLCCKKYDEMDKKRLTNGGNGAKVEPTSKRCNKNCFEQDTFFSQFPAHREPPGAEKADAGRKRKIPCEQPAGTGRAALVAQRRFAPVTGQRIRARWRARARQSGRLQKGGKRSGTAEAEFRRTGPLARRRLNAFVFGRGPARAKPGGTPGRGRFLHPFGRPCRCRPAAGMAADGHRRMKI